MIQQENQAAAGERLLLRKATPIRPSLPKSPDDNEQLCKPDEDFSSDDLLDFAGPRPPGPGALIRPLGLGPRLPGLREPERTRRWCCLILIVASGSCASGPLWSWPTLEPILQQEGVWEGPGQLAKLSSVFGIASGVVSVSNAFSGMLYDSVGPRTLAAGSAFVVTICLLGMALAVGLQSWNNLLWVAYPAAMAFGMANSMAVYAWLWLLPDEQSTVSSFIGVTQCLTDCFVFLAVFISKVLGLNLYVYFTLMAIMSAIAGTLALALVPSRSLLRKIQTAVTNKKATEALHQESPPLAQRYGTTDDQKKEAMESGSGQMPEDSEFTFCEVVKNTGKSLLNALFVTWRIHPSFMLLFFLFVLALMNFMNAYPTEMYPLYLKLMGAARATELVDMFGVTSSLGGAAAVLMFGWFVDRAGLVAGVALVVILIFAICSCLLSATVWLQVVAQLLFACVMNSFYVIGPRTVLIYAPPELFGSMVSMMALTLGSLVILSNVLCYGLYSHPGLLALRIDMWGVFSIVMGFCLQIWWWFNPLPAIGTTTIADAQDAYTEPERDVVEVDYEAGKDIPVSSGHKRNQPTSCNSCCSCWQYSGA